MGEALQITFWGVRGSVPVSGPHLVGYGGNTSCVEVKADNGTCIILDGGTGIFPLGSSYMQHGIPDRLAIFITHAHWDHIQGLPFFAPAYVPDTTLMLYGCDQGALRFSDILAVQMQSPYFPVKLSAWSAAATFTSIGETEVDVGGVAVRSIYAEHPGMTLGYRISYKGRSVAYVPDNEPFARFALDKVFAPRPGPAPAGDELEAVFLEEQKAKLLSLIGSADVLIHDAQYRPEEYALKVGWGHSSFEMAVSIALYGAVRHLVLFHHDPSRHDREIDDILQLSQGLAKGKGSALRVTAAQEQVTLDIA